ncbi:MAG: SGNH/GDSL hydrolase family protein [Ardenticatenia bacterium]|nr:SGNH/GDSL hydrolase family protein [Ardenticatenia bacterium]
MKVRISASGIALALLLTACQRQRPDPGAAFPQEAQRTIVPPAAGAADDLRPPPAPSDTLTPSITPTASDTPTPTPSPTPPPEAFWPVLPTIDGGMKQRLRAVYDLGQARGNRAGVFIKVGDSISASGAFLTDLGCGLGRLGEYGALQEAVDHFAATELPAGNSSARCGRGNSFTRRGQAAVVGWSAVHALRPLATPVDPAADPAVDAAMDPAADPAASPAVDPAADATLDAQGAQVTAVVSDTTGAAAPTAGPPPECAAPDITPLGCEILVTRPAVALVMYGTNDLAAGVDLGSYRHNLDMIVGQLLDAGVIPVLSTIPPRPLNRRANARVSGFNQVAKAVADARGIPLWNFWAQLAGPEMIHSGISGDGIHPSAWRYGGDFGPQGLRYGYNQRSLGALQMLDKLLRVVIRDGAAEG